MNPFWMILMYPFLAPFFNGMGGFGGFGNNGGAGFLANQINNDNGRELIMQAIQGNSNAIGQLSSLLNTTHDQIQAGINSLNTAILTTSNGVSMTGLQIINALQQGDTAIAQQLCQGFSGIQSTLASNAAADQLAICQQTYALTDGANRNTQSILSKLDAMETRALQDKLEAAREKNTQLQGEISQLNQNQYFTGVVGQAVAPINAQLAALSREMDDVKCKLPTTATVNYQPFTVVPNYGLYGNGYWGNGFGTNFWT